MTRTRTCRICTKKIIGKRRGQTDDAQRLLFNLKQRCREQGLVEGKIWTKEHVQKLMGTVQFPESILKGIEQGLALPKLRIVRVDAEKPWLPDNAKIVI